MLVRNKNMLIRFVHFCQNTWQQQKTSKIYQPAKPFIWYLKVYLLDCCLFWLISEQIMHNSRFFIFLSFGKKILSCVWPAPRWTDEVRWTLCSSETFWIFQFSSHLWNCYEKMASSWITESKLYFFIIFILETLAKYKALQEEMEKYKHDLDEARSIIEELQNQLTETTVSTFKISINSFFFLLQSL